MTTLFFAVKASYDLHDLFIEQGILLLDALVSVIMAEQPAAKLGFIFDFFQKPCEIIMEV